LSPIAGVVIARRASVGQSVAPDPAAPSLFLVADLSRMKVLAPVAEADIGKVKAGQAARFTTELDPKRVYTGKVARVRLDAQTARGVVSYTVEIDVDNRDGALLPYLTATVRIMTGDAKE